MPARPTEAAENIAGMARSTIIASGITLVQPV